MSTAAVGGTARAPTAPVGPGLGAAGAPPFVLPGEHFGAALLFLLAGAAGLVWIAPELAAGRFLMPRVVAVTHLFTLGWITTSIMGALYQLLPVALSQPIRSERVAHLTFLLYAPGLALFIAGLAFGLLPVMLAGAACFGTGVLGFVVNLSLTLRRAARRDVTWWALAGASFFLFVTLLVGVALAGNLRWGYLGAGRLDALATHLHVALAGWVLLVVVGVGQRLLPMFLLSHGADARFGRAAVALIAAGTLVLALLHHLPPPISRWLPYVLISAGAASFLVQARQFYAHSHKPKLDAGMRLAAAALVLLGAGLLLAGPVLFTGVASSLATSYVGALVLGFTLFVAAHYYKILPFLVWYHRFGPLAGKQPVPRVGDLYDARWANGAAALLAGGAVLLLAASALGAGVLARAGAALFAAGTGIEAVQMFFIARRKP